MKRRCSKPNPNASSRIPSLSKPDMSMNRRKRAKFTDINGDNPLNFRPDASSRPERVTQAPRSDEAKTSEFAFFKKLKEDAGQRFTSGLAHDELNQTDNYKSVIKNALLISEENINVVNNSGNEKIRSSLLIKSATPVQFVSFRSPVGSAGTRKNSDLRMKKACSALEAVQWKQKDMEEYSHSLRPEGTQSRHAEVFKKKRQNLRRWVTDVSFPEIDGLCSNGCDIVSRLLGRLIPESKDNNNVKDHQKLGQVETDAKSLLVASSESDIYCKRLQWTPRDFTEFECGPYLGDAISDHPWNRSRRRLLFLDAPQRHDNRTHHHYKVWDYGLQDGTRSLCAEGDASCVFPVRRLRSVELLEEFNEYCQPNRYLVGNQSNMPMLDWDYDNNKVERNLSISSHDMEPNSHSLSLAPRVYDDKSYANELFSSSNVHISEEPEFSLPLSRLSSYHNHEHGIQILEGEEDTLPDSNHLPLTLSCRTNYTSSDEDFSNDTGFLHQDPWYMSKLLSQRHHYPQKEALLRSGLVLDLEWKFIRKSGFPEENCPSSYQALEYPRNQSLSSHYNEHEYESCLDDSSHKRTLAHFSEESEDNIGIHDWSSFYYQASLDSNKAFPLILDS